MFRLVSRKFDVGHSPRDMWIGEQFETLKEALTHFKSCKNLYWMRYAYAMFIEEDGLRRWSTRKDFILLDEDSK